ncbi:DUF6894 family protein [Methylobacterium planeticum]|uniref:DUF6894 domain-containing protein n=1 Tax=Methylobacterium planeticum TaxID=2615211 RepID=A0A6N6MKC8_9HYPH|nr:hypothetical protein [Methylobacterium planeticum]KAB1071646.1 hypothetical protein F6X51_18970 [Methylobacterium planeticum]
MPRYFFDLHSDCLSEWDDEGIECHGGEEIVHHALAILRSVPKSDGAMHAPTVVTARDAAGRVIVTATLKPRLEARIQWAEAEIAAAGASTVPLAGRSASAP